MFSRTIIAIAFACLATAQTPPHVDPERMLWTAIKQELTGADADEYFQSSMKDALLPRLKGTLISAWPNGDGIVVGLGFADTKIPHIALVLHGPNAAIPIGFGLPIEFSAVAIGFTKDPFLVTFDVDKDSVVTKPFGMLAPFWYVGHPLGEVKSGRYRNGSTSVEFDLPSDWTVEGTHPSTDNGEIAILKHSPFEGAIAGVWMVRHTIRAEEISKRLLAVLPETVTQRSGLQGYSVRPESVQQRWISGGQALTAVADYQENGAKMSESLTWIITEHTRALFFVRIGPYDLPIFQTSFDQIISSAVVP